MKKKETAFVGIDIGTSKIVCAVGLHQPDAAAPNIVGLGTSPTVGLRRGTVIDVEETVSSITSAVEEAERMSGVAIDSATVSIDGAHLKGLNSHGSTAVGRADHEITREDMFRAEEEAMAINLDSNNQILEVIPLQYKVDNQSGIADPVGMNGVRLEVDTHVITAASPAVKNINNAVFRSGIKIKGQTTVGLAAAQAVLSKRQKELGVLLIHIGAETTSILLYEEGQLSYSAVLPIGSNHITKDLVYGLRTNIDIAEKLKIKYASALKESRSKKVSLEEFGGKGSVSISDIEKIVHSRLDEIYGMIAAELKKVEYESMLSAGIVLSGGGSKLQGLVEFTKKTLKLPTTMGKISAFGAITEKMQNPEYAAAIGLMLLDMEEPQSSQSISSKLLSKVVQKIKSIFTSLKP